MERYYQKEIECASREQIRTWQDERLVRQVRHVWDNVPYYRAKMETAHVAPDDIKGRDDLYKLPFLSKADLREAYPFGLLAEPLEKCIRIHSTSGTTGKRVVAFYTKEDIDLWNDCCARALAAAGAGPEDVCQVAYGYGLFTGGFGLNGSRFGILIDEGVNPLDISYYILGYGRDVYMKYGDYEHRGQNRSRFILTKLGDDAFRQAVRDAVAKAKAEGDYRLTIEEETPLAKSGADDSVLEDGRIGKQKQAGLYYVEYKPLGGTPKLSVFRELLKTLQTMEGAEIRLNADETAYIINLTADEARKVAALTADDTATTAFEHSVSCIGATVCQQGLRDSHGTFVKLAQLFKDRGIDSHFLPKCHFSGCPSNCTVQQLAPLGLRGASKKIGDKMEPAFNIYAGGNYAIGKGVMGEQIGVITIEHLPDFFLALNQTLLDANQSYDEWYPQHKEKLIELVNQFE